MQGDEGFQFVGEMGAPFRLAAQEGLPLAIIGRGQMIDARKPKAESLAIGDHAAHRNPAEAYAVISTHAPDETLALRLAEVLGHGVEELFSVRPF